MKRRVELPVRVVRKEVEELAVPKDDLHQRSQNVEAEPRKKRKVVKTSVTTVTTIVTEAVDAESQEEVVHGQPQHQPETQEAREDRRRLLRQLDLLKEQLLEEERQQRHHHHHHQLHHHPAHETQRHEVATHDDSAGRNVVDDHALSQRPPFSPTPSSRLRMQQASAAREQVEVMEKGYIYFLYRPKVGAQEAKSFDDVARMYILLKTLPKKADALSEPEEEEIEGDESAAPAFYRLIRIGKKKLPSIREHNRFWGIIEEATHDYEKIHHLIVSEHYTTLTLGERVTPACRPAGEGVYGIVKRDNYSHLAYVLELPHELGEVQKALNIVAEGCFVLSVKNPEALPYSTYSATLPTKPVPRADTDQGIPLPALDDRRAVQQMIHDQPGLPRRDPSTVPQSPLRIEFPPHLQAAFQGKRFAAALPLEMLDQKGVEVVLIGESDNLAAEFGRVGQQLEGEVIDAQTFTDEDLLRELHLTKKENPIEPLRYGTWA